MLSGRVLLLETGFVRLGHPQQTLYWSWQMMTDFRLRQAEAVAEGVVEHKLHFLPFLPCY